MIPLMLDLTGRKVLIFGGGDVGARKAAYLQHEADVTAVSRSFSPAFDTLPVSRWEADLSQLSDDGIRNLLGGVFLAVAATSDPDLNDRIGRICREGGILFNNAAGEPGEVVVPSVVRGRHYLIAISTAGKSPAVSRYLRMRLQEELADLDRMIEVQEEVRTALKETEPSQEKRSAVLWSILSDREVWDTLATDPAGARRLVKERYLHA